ncbi:MAG: reverse transcriptase domain-containing protein [archaeon]
MKTYKNLFEKVCSLRNLHIAYCKAREGKRYGEEVLGFSYNLEENLLKLKEELETHTYKHGKYKEFYVRDPKMRLIKAAPFRDRVVHHALCNMIEPIFDCSFIHDSYACRKDKGTHKGVERLQRFIRSDKDNYALKCDIRKYFSSVDHQIMLELITKRIKDKEIIWLVNLILESSITYKESRACGIPIGNLTSQLFANIYLNELDYFAKHKLKVEHYIRYVDDFLFLHESKQSLHEIRKQVISFLESLKLEIHTKKAVVFQSRHGIDFLGYRVFYSYRLLRKSGVKKFLKELKKLKIGYEKNLLPSQKIYESLNSWIAHASHADTYGLRTKIFSENPFVFDVYYEVELKINSPTEIGETCIAESHLKEPEKPTGQLYEQNLEVQD